MDKLERKVQKTKYIWGIERYYPELDKKYWYFENGFFSSGIFNYLKIVRDELKIDLMEYLE